MLLSRDAAWNVFSFRMRVRGLAWVFDGNNRDAAYSLHVLHKKGKEEEILIKGIQRKMVLIRTPDSKIFEEAHFVFRAESDSRVSEENDMLIEANRIIEEAGLGATEGKHPVRKKRGGGLIGFLLGGLFGGGVVGMIWLLCALL